MQKFTVKIKSQKEDETGKIATVTSEYLVKAVNYGEAEVVAYKLGEQNCKFGFLVEAITKATYKEIFGYDESHTWFKAKVSHVLLDEASGKEKTVAIPILVNAETLSGAVDSIHSEYAQILSTFRIQNVCETAIEDIIEANTFLSGQEPEKDDFDKYLSDN